MRLFRFFYTGHSLGSSNSERVEKALLFDLYFTSNLKSYFRRDDEVLIAAALTGFTISSVG